MNRFEKFNKARFEHGICSRYTYHPHGRDADWIISTIADMDFNNPKEIIDGMVEEISRGNLVYTWGEVQIPRAIRHWMKKHQNLEVKPEDIVWANGVIQLMQYALQAISKPGDGVIIQTPVYTPFYACINENGRKVVENPLRRVGNTFEMDFADLEEKMKDNKVLILCSPHNPIGRVWMQEELEKLIELAKANDVKIICDSIWEDIIFSDHKMVHLHHVNKEWAEQNVFLLTSWSKTFNLGGTQHGFLITSNEEAKGKIWHTMESHFHMGSLNVGTVAMVDTIYHNEESLWNWVVECTSVLETNSKLLCDRLSKETNGNIQVITNDGMFVTLIDFSKVFKSKEALNVFMEKCKVGLAAGDDYGKDYALFKRINFAMPTSVINDIIDRIVNQYKTEFAHLND